MGLNSHVEISQIEDRIAELEKGLQLLNQQEALLQAELSRAERQLSDKRDEINLQRGAIMALQTLLPEDGESGNPAV